MSGLQWYVLKVISKREEKIKANLQAEVAKASLQSSVGEILIPCEKVYEIRAGKKQMRHKNLLPGYILLQADLSNDALVQLLKRITGTFGILGERGWKSSYIPLPMSQEDVDRFVGKTKMGPAIDVKLSSVYAVGEVVEIIEGPFTGFSAKIEEIFEEKKTLKVVVKIFDERSTPVELSYMQVKKFFN